jgi:hypothetical protein
MKRWSKIAAVAGFLIVFAFACERFLQVRALWAGLSWADLRDIGHDLSGLGLLAAMFFVILWVGALLWRKIWPKSPRKKHAASQLPVAGHWRRVAELTVISVVLGPMVDFGWGMRGPGALAAHGVNYLMYRLGMEPSLGLTLILIFGVDAAVFFAILWGGHLLCMTFGRKAT